MGEELASPPVSSAAIRSASRRTLSALKVMSSKLPMGVAQINSSPQLCVTGISPVVPPLPNPSPGSAGVWLPWIEL